MFKNNCKRGKSVIITVLVGVHDLKHTFSTLFSRLRSVSPIHRAHILGSMSELYTHVGLFARPQLIDKNVRASKN